ncbi:hypothetical protein CSA_016972, partial [Cucumis sativus]
MNLQENHWEDEETVGHEVEMRRLNRVPTKKEEGDLVADEEKERKLVCNSFAVVGKRNNHMEFQ